MELVHEERHRPPLPRVERRLLADRQRYQVQDGRADQGSGVLTHGAPGCVHQHHGPGAQPDGRVDGGAGLPDDGAGGAAPGEPLHFRLDFPSIVWAEVDYSVYVLRQASRRSWRIGQHQPVEVTFLTYAGTLQAEALGLVAAKTRASLMVEGELPEEGLAALDGDGGDVYLALARRLVGVGDTTNSQAASLEALFADARRSEAAADELLVTDGWEEERGWSGVPLTFPVQSPAVAAGPVNDLPLFTTDVTRTSPVSAPPDGSVVTLAELAQIVRRRKVRRRLPPEEQLALFLT